MTNKEELQITEKMFNLENDVITIALNAPEYDLTGKIITAVFSPSGVETEPLEVVDGVIQIPIYTSMIERGINLIQLNFRWGTTKLEQSGKLMWVIDQSLGTPGPTHRDIDIISYLINEINTAKETADRVVSDVGDIKVALDSSIEDAGESKVALEGSISTAGTTKTGLDGSITSANSINNTLSNPTTGTIKLATDSKTALDGSIVDAGTAKSEIEQAITNNQIVTLPVFNAHKEDYAKQANIILGNELRNSDFSNGASSWSFTGLTNQIVGNILELKGNGSVTHVRMNQHTSAFKPSVNDIIYVKILNKIDIQPIRLEILVRHNIGAFYNSGVIFTGITPQKWESLSFVFETKVDFIDGLRLYFSYEYGSTTNAKDKIVEVANIISINLTKVFGKGNEPTTTEMDLLLKQLPNEWFDGELILTQMQIMNWQLTLIRQANLDMLTLDGEDWVVD